MLCLDIVGTALTKLVLATKVGVKDPYLVVQAVWVYDIVVDDFDINASFRRTRNIFEELSQFRPTDTVRTIHRQWTLDFGAPSHPLECCGKLFVVSLLCGLAILILGSQGILAADNVMQLRRGHKLHIKELGASSRQGRIEDGSETRARRPSVSAKDHPSGIFHFDIYFLDELVVDVADLL